MEGFVMVLDKSVKKLYSLKLTCTIGSKAKWRFWFPMEKNSSLPTLKASREIKNWFLPLNFYHEPEIKLLVCLPNFKAK
jgi:hypothetical protein